MKLGLAIISLVVWVGVLFGWPMWISLGHPDMGQGRLTIEFWPHYIGLVAWAIGGYIAWYVVVKKWAS